MRPSSRLSQLDRLRTLILRFIRKQYQPSQAGFPNSSKLKTHSGGEAMARRWLKRLLKIAGYVFLVLLVIIAGVIHFTVGWRPIFGPRARTLTDRKFDPTPARMERGRYLVENVMGCYDCHSQVDEKAGDIPALVSKKGAGRIFLEDEGMRVV